MRPVNAYLKTFAISALALSAAMPAMAQEIDIGEIVVTPNRTATEKNKVGSKVEKVTKKEIEERSQPLVLDYLNTLPGIGISSTGGVGAEGSLAIRGLPRRYVKTLYNGIDISDPSNTQVQTSYQYLLTGGVDDIEVLKGSQSMLYGSDAIAGVISMSTLNDTKQGVEHRLHFEGGSNGTAMGRYGLTAANERARFGANITGFRTDGISAAASGFERDGFNNVTADLAGEYRFSDSFSVFASALYIDSKSEYDNAFTAPPSDDPLNTNYSKQFAGRVGFNLDLMDGRLKNTFSLQGTDIKRDIVSTGFLANYNGGRLKADYQGSFAATDWLTLQYGADHERQTSDTLTSIGTPWVAATSDSFSMTGVWAQAVLQPIEALTLTGGLRYDNHSDYGDHVTYRGTASYVFAETGTRLHSSVGTGFRAPSLYELNDPFSGNPLLEPETSFSFDAGIEQTWLDGRFVGDVTFFMLDVDNLIINDASTGWVYQQVPGTTETRGVEVSGVWSPADWLNFRSSYTYTDSRLQTGARNIRVPRHAVGLSAVVRPAEKWYISATGKIALDTMDTGSFQLDDYFLLNAKIAYMPTDKTEVYLRADNVLDDNYQTARGFNSGDLAVYAGFKARF
ncbi:MAG: TonB-dependent receptor [Mesorhizobium sp.]